MAGSVDEVKQWLALAGQALESAEVLVKAGHNRDSISKAYYAMFYAAKAAVVSQGVQANKHSSVISAFGRLFSKTGRVPAHLHSTLIDAFEDRQDADYTLEWQTDRIATERRLEQAEEFVRETARSLALSGLIDV